jgi:hypothetical protein
LSSFWGPPPRCIAVIASFDVFRICIPNIKFSEKTVGWGISNNGIPDMSLIPKGGINGIGFAEDVKFN